MEYYYTDGTTNYGPFTLDELKQKNITRDTLVWYAGLASWKRAGELPELLAILGPPPAAYAIPQQPGISGTLHTPPKTWLLESILVTLFCCLPFGIAGIVFASRVESQFYAGNYEGAIRSSADAKKWTMISFWVGLAIGVIWIIAMIISSIYTIGNGGDFNI
jgi:hypothetical protein